MKQVDIKKIEPVYLNNRAAADYLQVSPTWLEDRRNNGELPYCKIGKYVFMKKTDLDKMIERCRVY